MKIIALLSVLLMATNFTYTQIEPETHIKNFFEQVSKGNLREAIEVLPTNQKFESDTSYATRLLTRLEIAQKNSGEYCGYELIEKNEVSPSFITYTYFIKYSNAPQRIQFTFYKPKEIWQVINISLNAQQGRQMPNRRQGVGRM